MSKKSNDDDDDDDDIGDEEDYNEKDNDDDDDDEYNEITSNFDDDDYGNDEDYNDDDNDDAFDHDYDHNFEQDSNQKDYEKNLDDEVDDDALIEEEEEVDGKPQQKSDGPRNWGTASEQQQQQYKLPDNNKEKEKSETSKRRYSSSTGNAVPIRLSEMIDSSLGSDGHQMAGDSLEKAQQKLVDEAIATWNKRQKELQEKQQHIQQPSPEEEARMEAKRASEWLKRDMEEQNQPEEIVQEELLPHQDPPPHDEDPKKKKGSRASKQPKAPITDTYLEELRNFRSHRTRADLIIEETDLSKYDRAEAAEIKECMKLLESRNLSNMVLYDLHFNVSNLMLAAIKHNPDAPIIMDQWEPQLTILSRYQDAQDRNFGYTPEDVENADLAELEQYYRGLGYDEIPKTSPEVLNVIEEEELDPDEIKMIAFRRWMNEVYNEEEDEREFNMQTPNKHNIFSDDYEPPKQKQILEYDEAKRGIEEMRRYAEEAGESTEELDQVAKEHSYEIDNDEEFQREFRGHLIIACTRDDEDLAIAEKITARMGEEYGLKVYVETRVYAHATPEDFVFEIWLESYNIDLLHSKRRAVLYPERWSGPALCDDEQIERLVDQVGYLISDEARYSYRGDEVDEDIFNQG